jgi:hypothetical protein
MKRFISLILLTIITSAGLLASKPSDHFAFMTCVSTGEQERSVRAMIRSIRANAGEYSNCKVYVVLAQPEEATGNSLAGDNVESLRIEVDSIFLDYPLAIKAFAASNVEQEVKKKIRTLVWLDPGVIVLNSLESLDLKGRFDVSVRPVSLVNNIGLPPGIAPDDYWRPIYKENRLDYKTVRTIETVVDAVQIQPYYNCEVYSINPGLGLCKEWAAQLEELLRDNSYQENTCTTLQRRLFLHQAVLSGIIASRIKARRIKALPLTSGYPFNQHDRLAGERKASSLNELSAVIFDYAWSSNPTWMDMMRIDEPLRSWLIETYNEYLQ